MLPTSSGGISGISSCEYPASAPLLWPIAYVMFTESDQRRLVDTVAGAFCHEMIDCHGALLLSTKQVRAWRETAPPSDWDPVAVESTMNKRAVVDLAGHAYDERSREELMTVGRAILRVWSERIALLFGDRDVVFYLGGSESVVIRFHVRRSGVADWLNLADREFLNASKIEIYLLHDRRLARMS
jgi:hypothetical protein